MKWEVIIQVHLFDTSSHLKEIEKKQNKTKQNKK